VREYFYSKIQNLFLQGPKPNPWVHSPNKECQYLALPNHLSSINQNTFKFSLSDCNYRHVATRRKASLKVQYGVNVVKFSCYSHLKNKFFGILLPSLCLLLLIAYSKLHTSELQPF